MKTFFFPIKSPSLAHYFGTAIIKPAKYFSNKPFDIQDRFKDFLLLTTKLGTKETDCCLEIVLTDDEIKELIDVNGGWFLFDSKPLPITRIKKIYFSDIEIKDITVANITMSTAYVPEILIEVCNFENNSSEKIQIPSDCNGVEQEEKIIQYDRFLGALALMKIAREPYMNYSKDYIKTLSFFNEIVDRQIDKINNFNFSDKYQGLFSKSKGFERILPYLNKHIDEQVLNQIAKEEKQVIRKDKITRVIDIDSLKDNTWTYTIAILYSFGVGDEGRKKRIDGLIQTHFSEISKEKSEGVALCYGYNRGYSAFSKDYGIHEKVSYKYKLESQLDYYTIESVYQYVFNGNVSSYFPYLDDWCPKLSLNGYKKNSDYVILDEIIIGKKKAMVFSEEWWNGLFPKFREFGRLANVLFSFFKEICEKIKEDIENDREELIASYESKLINNQKVIDDLTKMLNQKTEELKNSQQKWVNSDNTNVLFNKDSDFRKFKVSELKDIAKSKGIKIPRNPKKEEIIELLIKHESSSGLLFNYPNN